MCQLLPLAVHIRALRNATADLQLELKYTSFAGPARFHAHTQLGRHKWVVALSYVDLTPLQLLGFRQRIVRQALSTTGGGGIGNGGSGSKGVGGGGDDSGSPGKAAKEGILIRWQGWQERVAADPSFPYKVFIEQVHMLIC